MRNTSQYLTLEDTLNMYQVRILSRIWNTYALEYYEQNQLSIKSMIYMY